MEVGEGEGVRARERQREREESESERWKERVNESGAPSSAGRRPQFPPGNGRLWRE